jgi:hypothetical protein
MNIPRDIPNNKKEITRYGEGLLVLTPAFNCIAFVAHNSQTSQVHRRNDKRFMSLTSGATQRQT